MKTKVLRQKPVPVLFVFGYNKSDISWSGIETKGEVDEKMVKLFLGCKKER
jgi:hypothetical protein